MTTPIVQYSDDKGNKAYAYTHWDAVKSKPNVALKKDIPDLAEYIKREDPITLTSDDGQKFKLLVDNDGNLLTKKEG